MGQKGRISSKLAQRATEPAAPAPPPNPQKKNRKKKTGKVLLFTGKPKRNHWSWGVPEIGDLDPGLSLRFFWLPPTGLDRFGFGFAASVPEGKLIRNLSLQTTKLPTQSSQLTWKFTGLDKCKVEGYSLLFTWGGQPDTPTCPPQKPAGLTAPTWWDNPPPPTFGPRNSRVLLGEPRR